MKELVFKGANDQALTNSLLVAEKFEKNHRHILDSIRNLVAENSAAKMLFVESEYENRGKTYPMYVMNRDGFTLLAMGFTGAKAMDFKMEYLAAFNKMEQMLKSDDYILARSQEILHNRLQIAEKQLEDAKERIALQNEQLKIAATKVKSYDDYISSDGTFTVTQIAKEYGWGAETLNKKLKEHGVQYKQNGQWLLFSKYDGKGYTKSVPRTYTRSDGSMGTQMQTVWTSKGRELIHNIVIA